MNQFFDTIGGLPLHPLSVHAASVLIPLSAIALVILVFVPKWRKAYLPLTVGALAVSVVLAYVAKESGEALASRVGNPGEHEELGDILFPASVGLFLLGLTFFFITKSDKPKWVLQLAGGLSTIAVAGVVILSILVGHSGAEATWGNRIAATQGQELTAPTEPAPGASSESGISVAEVQKHNTATDCWSAVKGQVYDLTSYVNGHPGGARVIKAICGKDGSASFAGQQGSANKPNNVLAGFLLGPLVSGSTLPEATVRGDEEGEEEEGDDH
jgi:cytochrome b involved in lipid metabolism